MPKVHTHLCTTDHASLNLMQELLFASAEYPGTDGNGWLLGTLDEVEDLMRVSRRSDLIVRFRDRGFAEITTAWQWLGDGIGVAHLIVRGAVGQSHLMLAGTAAEQPVARAWLSLAGVVPDTAMPPTPAPALITLEREGYADHAGGYLLGMILFAPFCECCGVPEDAG